MGSRTGKWLKAGVAAVVLAAASSAPALAGEKGPRMERLDRGLIAASTGEGVFLSWRLLKSEVKGSSATGLTGANFHVYRDGKKIAIADIQEILRDHVGAPDSICRHNDMFEPESKRMQTNFSIIMNLSAREMMYTPGSPCGMEYVPFRLESGAK